MDFNYSDEQRMLSDSLEKLFVAQGGTGEGSAAADALWRACAEAGLVGLTVPEDHDGLAGSAVDVMVASIQIGRHKANLPFLSTAVAGAGALRSQNVWVFISTQVK